MRDREIHSELMEVLGPSSLLQKAGNVLPFSVPEAYFLGEAFTGPSECKGDFGIPDDYFSKLESRIRTKLNENTNDFESRLRTELFLSTYRQNSFELPPNYFQESEETLSYLIKLESRSKQNPFSVPVNYTFADVRQILNAGNKDGKVIRLFSPIALRSFAAAAILVCVCAFAWYLLQDKQQLKGLSFSESENLMENPSVFGIDDYTIAALVEEDPSLFSTIEDEAGNEILNEVIEETDVDLNILTD